MQIIKADGTPTLYDPLKIIRSLERAGAEPAIISEVVRATERELFNGISTKALYKIVYRNLRHASRPAAGKYHIKKAIMELGPSGFPFEKYIAALLEAEGFAITTNQSVQGHCVKHEVDVIAIKARQHWMMECKFHSHPGTVCDVKQALYVHARFMDLEKAWVKLTSHGQLSHQGWLVTNTRLSGDAEKYGRCVGLGLLSWNYPRGSSLRERIDHKGLYPITCLASLTKQEKFGLLQQGIVLCRHLCDNMSVLDRLPMDDARRQRLFAEAEVLCTIP